MSSAQTKSERPQLECPPSLRRRAPATATIRDEKNGQVRVSSSGFILLARHRYQVRLISSAGLPNDQIVQASLAPDEHIRPFGPVQQINLGDGRKEFVLGFLTNRLFRPFPPVQARVSIVLKHGRWEDYCHELPVVIWPSMSNRVLWAFSTVAGALWFPFIREASLVEGHLRPFGEVLDKLRGTKELLLLTAAASLGVGLVVYAVSWVYQLFVASDNG